jgi:hypothetical protein
LKPINQTAIKSGIFSNVPFRKAVRESMWTGETEVLGRREDGYRSSGGIV